MGESFKTTPHSLDPSASTPGVIIDLSVLPDRITMSAPSTLATTSGTSAIGMIGAKSRITH